jgi:hypothetical protein
VLSYEEEKIEENATCRNIKEVCDFPGQPKDIPESEEEVLGVTTPPERVTLPSEHTEEQSPLLDPIETSSSYSPDQKKVLRQNISRDVNLLLRLYLTDWLPNN